MTEQQKAEQLKKEMYYDPCPEEDEEYEECETCDYTGEDCFGDKRFCEECPILTDEWEEKPASNHSNKTNGVHQSNDTEETGKHKT